MTGVSRVMVSVNTSFNCKLSVNIRHFATGGGTYSADTAIAVPLLKVVRLIM